MTIQSVLQGALRAGIASDATRVGPFLVVVDADSTNPFRNFAVPDDDATPTPEDVAALLQWFADHDRIPRLEFVRPVPAVEAALTAGGFTVAKSFPLLVLDEPVQVEPPPGIRLGRPTVDDELRAVARVQNAAYGEPGVSDADVARLRRALDSGAQVVAAWDGATVVAAGQLGRPRTGFAELHSVATDEAYRRRGIASAVAAELSCTPDGVTPFLQAEGPAEQRMYERLGYRPIGDLVDVRGPVAADRSAPAILADETATQLAFLDYLRTAVARKLIGLSEEDARRPLVASGTSLLWLAKHVAAVEAGWLHHIFAGDPEDVVADEDDLSADTVGSVLSLLRTVGGRSAEIVAEHPDPDEPTHEADPRGNRRTLRWVLAHLVEETGRHAGHADILRELLDGSTGR